MEKDLGAEEIVKIHIEIYQAEIMSLEQKLNSLMSIKINGWSEEYLKAKRIDSRTHPATFLFEKMR